ncbi:PorV/PorQ family protein [candidate division KSB1 bacterium]|nr:PorV/PorQ family protein [candidate division KSB1 bacterium]
MKNRVIFPLVILCVVMAVIVSSLNAQEARNRKIGSAAATELLIPVGARDLAMGGSSIAISQGVDAIHWNPAGLGRLASSAEGLFSTMSYIADINLTYGAVGVSFGGFGVVGLSVRSLGFGDIPLTTNDDPEGLAGRTFSPSFITVGLSYARAFTDAITAGGTIKIISEKMGRVTGSGVAVDFGVQYHGIGGIPGLHLGVALKNFGTQVDFGGSGLLRRATSSEGRRPEQHYSSEAASYELPSIAEFGLTYQRTLSENLNLSVNGTFSNNNLALDGYRIGGEIGYRMEKIQFFGRGGIELAQTSDYDEHIFGPTMGFGLFYAAPGVNITIDYAWRQVEYFDNNSVFSFKFGF